MVIIFCILVVLTLFREIFSAMRHPVYVGDGCFFRLSGRAKTSLWAGPIVELFDYLVRHVSINESTCYFCGQARKNYNIVFYVFAAL